MRTGFSRRCRASLRLALALLATAPGSEALAQDPNDALPNQIVTAQLAGRSISGLVTHQPGATQFTRGILLFPGAPGILRLRMDDGVVRYEQRGNFLVRARLHWLDAGTLTVVIDAPDDQWGSFAQRFRATPRYGEDVAGLLGAVEANHGKLDWTFVGTSEGSVSAFHAARMLPGRAARVILTSSVFLPGRNGPGLADADWAALKAPLLWVHHIDDPCYWTRYADAEKYAKLTGAPLVAVQGGGPWRGDACMAFSAHGFAGTEQKVVTAMHEWVKTGKVPGPVSE